MRTHDVASIAIIGGGISGLTCATELARQSFSVVVFDKARGPGGRMSTRRVPELGAGVGFDHGAQYFTARSSELLTRVDQWLKAGVVRPWEGRLAALGPEGVQPSGPETERFVGTPGMNAVCRHLASEIDLRVGVQIQQIMRNARGWTLVDSEGAHHGPHDFLICSAPAPQTAKLLERGAPEIATRAAAVRMQPCWAVLAAFPDALSVPFDGCFINEGPLSWAARSSAKPGRKALPDRWVLHAGPIWSAQHLEEGSAQVAERLLEAFFQVLESESRAPAWLTAHRWRYALADNALDEGFVFDPRLRVGACGDWANGNRVEGAFLSGLGLAREVALVGSAFNEDLERRKKSVRTER
ncbi:MAG: hypothetical protein AMJ63_16890 [Myxococcales bacterium SG8_38_1]|nr:MAG: hypothetical protein AMJ63_16890 [Myxococcales bacterium SG8_38_1]